MQLASSAAGTVSIHCSTGASPTQFLFSSSVTMDMHQCAPALVFMFSGSKITADGDYSDEIKRPLLLGRKAVTNLDSMLKSRDITLMTKVHLVKAVVFPGVMYRCESWTIKKHER